jgi:hypothetical protein
VRGEANWPRAERPITAYNRDGRADRRRFASAAGIRMAGERAMETELKFKLKAGQGAQAEHILA